MGANKLFRHWGVSNYASVINQILTHPSYANRVRFLCFGDKSEANLYSELNTQMKFPDRIVNVIGKTTFSQLAAALSACRLLLSGDTGTMHLATAVQTRVLALFYASAYYLETGPYGNDHLVIASNRSCYPCFNPTECPYELACRDDISVAAVMDGVRYAIQPENPCNWEHKSASLLRSSVNKAVSYSLV